MNQTLANSGKEILKGLLVQCSEAQQLMFKRMYCHKNLELPINDAVDQMADDKISFAITQCEKTVENNANKISELN